MLAKNATQLFRNFFKYVCVDFAIKDLQFFFYESEKKKRNSTTQQKFISDYSTESDRQLPLIAINYSLQQEFQECERRNFVLRMLAQKYMQCNI